MVGNLTEKGVKLKRVFIEPKLPEGLAPLMELAHNLWWTWNHPATDLFRSIDPARFEALDCNAIALLDELSTEKANALLADKTFVERMKSSLEAFRDYMKGTPAAREGLRPESPLVAYFCMEYGLHQSVRLYSGGLGILAGDYLKEISDRNFNCVAVGLLYRYGYFQQEISLHGEQVPHLEPAKFTQLPIEPVRNEKGDWVKIHVNLEGQTVWAKVWRLPVGRMSLYLLDTDFEDNRWEDRSLTHQLYSGDKEHRLRQEILLGIGGARALKAIGLEPDLYHLNEGHAAFLGLERLANYMKDKQLGFEEALEIVRATQLFTTHTPVPAGHDSFSDTLVRDYLYEYTYLLDISWEVLLGLGKLDAANAKEPFSVSHLALRTCQESNGVSRLHGLVSQKMFVDLWPDYHWQESHIGYVTNSVHFPTWVSSEWFEFYSKNLGDGFWHSPAGKKAWEKIRSVPASEIMAVRKVLKKKLLDWVKTSLQADLMRRGENPRAIFEITNGLTDDALVIGFARRFATYKRATLLFTNEERLAEIVGNSERPVIFIFAGKAHPADKEGQEFIRLVYNTTQDPRFKGKVIFLENYSMEMAKRLTAGVDIWLNNPMRPLEASGTSGMKAVMNGVMNFSVLDGWWCEGYQPGAGWALPEHETYTEPTLQNELDAETIYNLLEEDIVPAFYDRDAQGVSERWVSHIRNTIADIAPEFVMKRMLDDYQSRYYSKLWERSKQLKTNQLAPAKDLAAWKTRVRKAWPAIELVNLETPDTFNRSLPLGQLFEAKATLNLHELKPADVGVELVFFTRKIETELDLVSRHELAFVASDGTQATYACSVPTSAAGVFEYGFRLFPKHALLPHRMDFGLVRWL